MLVIKHEPHARSLVNPQYVGGRKAEVIVLKHQPAANGFGSPFHISPNGRGSQGL